jgi:hypothetical protein
MLFAGGTSRLTSMFATHPPLVDRIKALDPAFDESEYPVVTIASHASSSRLDDGQASGFTSRLPGTAEHTIPASISDVVGRPDPEQVAFAADIRRTIPGELYDAAHSPEQAWMLTLALAVDRDASRGDRQLHFINEQLGVERSDLIRRLVGQIGQIGAEYRLPLLEIAFPALKLRPKQQREYFLELVKRLIELDGVIDLYEYCFYRVLSSTFDRASDPSGRHQGNRAGKKEIRQAAVDLLMTVAHHGHETHNKRVSAFQAGIAEFGKWASDTDFDDKKLESIPSLDRGLNVLKRMNSAGTKSLLQALAKTVSHDGKMTTAEAELFRAICASLDCPLPPILGQATAN